jgi:hypothetical protein
MTTKKRVVIYTRVSSDHQTTETQERELREIAGRLGWTIVKVYRDEGISQAKGRDGSPHSPLRHGHGLECGPTEPVACRTLSAS